MAYLRLEEPRVDTLSLHAPPLSHACVPVHLTVCGVHDGIWQMLFNSLALEIVVLCMFYSRPTDGPMTINPISIIVGGATAAAICIPGMLLFTCFFDPPIFVRLVAWLFRRLFCWPCALFRVLCICGAKCRQGTMTMGRSLIRPTRRGRDRVRTDSTWDVNTSPSTASSTAPSSAGYSLAWCKSSSARVRPAAAAQSAPIEAPGACTPVIGLQVPVSVTPVSSFREPHSSLPSISTTTTTTTTTHAGLVPETTTTTVTTVNVLNAVAAANGHMQPLPIQPAGRGTRGGSALGSMLSPGGAALQAHWMGGGALAEQLDGVESAALDDVLDSSPPQAAVTLQASVRRKLASQAAVAERDERLRQWAASKLQACGSKRQAQMRVTPFKELKAARSLQRAWRNQRGLRQTVNLRGTRAPSHHDGSVASPPPSPAQSEEPTTPSPQQGGFASRPRPILLPQDSGQASPAPRKSVSMRVLESAGEPSARSAAGSTRRMSTLLKRAVSSLALTTPTAREYSHASLNEHMLTKSLTRSIRDRHWRAVALISTGWALNLTCFLGLLFVFVLYGCGAQPP